MQQILADLTASISEVKTNPSGLIDQAEGETIAILNRNTPTAYLVSPEVYEKLLDALDELELIKLIKQRLKSEKTAVEVSLDEL